MKFEKIANGYLHLQWFDIFAQLVAYTLGLLQVSLQPLDLALLALLDLSCYQQLLVQPLDVLLRPPQTTVDAPRLDAGAASIAWLSCLRRSLGRPLLFLLHAQIRLGQSLEHF